MVNELAAFGGVVPPSGGGDLHPAQVAAWRRMGAIGRSRLGMQLRRDVRRWKIGALRTQHPDWSEEQLWSAVRALYSRERT